MPQLPRSREGSAEEHTHSQGLLRYGPNGLRRRVLTSMTTVTARAATRASPDDRFEDVGTAALRGRRLRQPANGYRADSRDEDRSSPGLIGPRDFDRPTRVGCACAVPPALASWTAQDGGHCSKRSARWPSTRCRPKDNRCAHHPVSGFRDGTPVIMNLVTMDNADAKRLVELRRRARVSALRVLSTCRHNGPSSLTVPISMSPPRTPAHREAVFYAYQ